MNWLIGIDEAGRGPLAGPVAVGVALIPLDFSWEKLPLVNDSKQLTERQRELIYKEALQMRQWGELDFQVSLASASTIDRIGIVPTITQAMERALKRLEKRSGLLPQDIKVMLDGALYAPRRFKNQETIIGGDGKEKTIGLASIVAKVTRDHHMKTIDSLYPEYDFAVHKGYGTKKHRLAIEQYGLSDIHRRSFCRNILIKTSVV